MQRLRRQFELALLDQPVVVRKFLERSDAQPVTKGVVRLGPDLVDWTNVFPVTGAAPQKAPVPDERPLRSLDDFEQRDRGRWPGEFISTVRRSPGQDAGGRGAP